MSEDERTLWVGNLSEKVTDELLYELCLQAGPVQNVNIPRDNDKRQRSYAFVTYVHASSVEYAMRIFEGSALFKRLLTLDKKIRNGPNSLASPKENFKYPSPNGPVVHVQRFQNEPIVHKPDTPNSTVLFNGLVARPQEPIEHNVFMSNGPSSNGNEMNNAMMRNGLLSAMAMAMGTSGCTPEMLMLMGQQMLGAELPSYEDNSHQSSTHRNKMTHSSRHHRNPYSRNDRHDRNRDRSDSRSQRYRNEHDDRCGSRDRDHRKRR